ncbi:50S ribosomal protein L25 [Caldicoprobacter algeriensis]|uniref:50S ribosomal protein L25 n=1 Tax=Caldicoprobacter algeriensis TaxID=699281 RepID=UPI00207A82AB|nr:50S ribosomal protein L25 [Caldicoprobacter algeriensis]
MNNRVLKVLPRGQDKSARQLRRQGFVPAIYYGGNQAPRQLVASRRELNSLMRQLGESALFEIAMEEDVRTVILKEVQRDPVTREVIHIDLQDLAHNEKVGMNIPIRLVGADELESKGRVLQRQAETVNVEGYAHLLPSHIDVYVGDMEPGDVIKVCDLRVDGDIAILDPLDRIVAIVLTPE